MLDLVGLSVVLQVQTAPLRSDLSVPKAIVDADRWVASHRDECFLDACDTCLGLGVLSQNLRRETVWHHTQRRPTLFRQSRGTPNVAMLATSSPTLDYFVLADGLCVAFFSARVRNLALVFKNRLIYFAR